MLFEDGYRILKTLSTAGQPNRSRMFRVITPGFESSYDRWTDALNQANSLIPQCKGLFKDIRIYYGENLIWVYSRLHKYPQYIGPWDVR